MFMRYAGGGVGHANQDSQWKMQDNGNGLDEEMDIDSDNEAGASDMVGISTELVEQMSPEEDDSDSDSDSDATDSSESDGSDDSDEPLSSDGGDMGPEDGDGVDDSDEEYGAF